MNSLPEDILLSIGAFQAIPAKYMLVVGCNWSKLRYKGLRKNICTKMFTTSEKAEEYCILFIKQQLHIEYGYRSEHLEEEIYNLRSLHEFIRDDVDISDVYTWEITESKIDEQITLVYDDDTNAEGYSTDEEEE